MSSPVKVSRFIFNSKHFTESTGKVRYNIYKPPRSHPDEVSVYNSSTLSKTELFEIGKNFVESERSDGKKIRASGDILQSIIETTELGEGQVGAAPLKVESEPTPHPLHMNILGFGGLHEGQQNILAKKLSDKTNLLLRDDE